MAIIKPFRAVRPTRDKAALVTTRSYDIYSKKERNSILRLNPFSFLHILRPGFKFNKWVTGEERFKLVFNRFCEFKENDVFIKDAKPTYYLHQKSHKNSTYWGIIALSSIDDCKNKVIKKHEKTLKDREELFGNYLNITGFNAEPVLITYPDNEQINSIYEKYKAQRAEYEFTTNKNRTHLLWLIDEDSDVQIIKREFQAMESVYIADGHHRTASSEYLSHKLNTLKKTKVQDDLPHNYFMSYLIPESILKISSFCRLVNSLNNLSKKEFLIQLDEYFRIENLGNQYYKPSKKHHFSMYLDGDYYKLYLRKSNYKINNALEDLDPQLLFNTVLKPILGIDDLSKDDRITYIPENTNQLQLKSEVDSGNFAVGFGLYPVSISQLKLVADEQLTMPPKSTYIEPKLRTGLTVYELK